MMKICLYLCGLCLSLAVQAGDMPSAILDGKGIRLDIPYVELTTPNGTLAYSLRLNADTAQAGMPFFLDRASVQALPRKQLFPVVDMQTNFGTVRLRLNAEKAPLSVQNLLAYAQAGFYDGTIFHRVIGSFVIQGGGYTTDYTAKTTRAPIYNEANNGLKNLRGTLAMARTSKAHSATSQFYINLVDNPGLDFPGQDSWGYTVLGEVISGLDIVDRIGGLATGAGGPFTQDLPQIPVIIERMALVDTP